MINTGSINEQFKYEVAFSFLSRDESLAQHLNDLLQDRISTFIYPERQLEIAGKDGEVALKKAFGSESRVVVILYRNEWGTTDWTRVEQEAIRERGHHHGFDFCLIIPLENPPSKPEWFPSYNLWIGIERWGNEAAAAVIEARIQQAGGITREESLADRKARLERQIVSAEKRKAFLESEKALQPAGQEAQRVFNILEEMSKSLSTASFPLQSERMMGGVKVVSSGFDIRTYWHQAYSNSLSNSGLHVRLYQIDTNERYDLKYNEIRNFEFEFSLNESDQHGWKARSRKKEFFNSSALAEFALRLLLDKVADSRQEKANG